METNLSLLFKLVGCNLMFAASFKLSIYIGYACLKSAADSRCIMFFFFPPERMASPNQAQEDEVEEVEFVSVSDIYTHF